MTNINETNFDERIIKSGKVSLIAFVAEWCKPSILQKEVIGNLKEKLGDFFEIHLVDVDENEALADKYHAKTLPAIALFAKGEIVEILLGYQPEDFLLSYMEHLKSVIESELEKSEDQNKP